jgi:RNA-binding protein
MLSSKQRSYLSGLAAQMQPTVMVGKEGASPAVQRALEMEFRHRELVKLRFVASKEERADLAASLAGGCAADLVRLIGNTAIFYRRAEQPGDRTIQLP